MKAISKLVQKLNLGDTYTITPNEIIVEHFNKIPQSIFKDPNTKFLDPCCGTGSFYFQVLELLNENLKDVIPNKDQRIKHILQNQLYAIDICHKQIRRFIRILSKTIGLDLDKFKTNIYNTDSLTKFPEELKNMKFDIIGMNPPYQIKVGPKKTEPIWQKFVLLMIDKYVKDDGYVLSIHPAGWRASEGRFSEVKEKYLENQLIWLSMNDYKKGKETFGVGTAYDVVLVKKEKSKNNHLTKIVSEEGEDVEINLAKMPFIPNGCFSDFLNLLPKNEEEKVEVLYSRSAYGSDKANMSFDKTQKNVYPCVYTIGKNGIPKFMYSDTKGKGHFGVPKIIWSNGAATVPIIDSIGEYGMTQFSYGIADKVENLPKIKKALENEKFIALMSKVSYSSHKYNYKVISCLKKDWWTDFQ